MKFKNLFTAMTLFIAMMFFVACEGPEGPAGKDGTDGQDGADGGTQCTACHNMSTDLAVKIQQWESTPHNTGSSWGRGTSGRG